MVCCQVAFTVADYVGMSLHLDSVTTNYGKRTVKYKASKMLNQLPSSLKEFLSVKNFRNKLKKFLQIVDIDNTV